VKTFPIANCRLPIADLGEPADGNRKAMSAFIKIGNQKFAIGND